MTVSIATPLAHLFELYRTIVGIYYPFYYSNII